MITSNRLYKTADIKEKSDNLSNVGFEGKWK